jgi:drug/metabolite transporter (DMT)-like permease
MANSVFLDDQKAHLRNRRLGLLCLLSGAVLFSCKAIVIKLAYQYEVSSISLLGLRMAFSLPLFLLIGYYRRERSSTHGKLKPGDYGALFFLGISGYYLASYTDFLGLRYLSAGMERLILFSYPTMVLVLQLLIFGVPIRRIQWVAVVICYGGIALAFSGADFSAGSNVPLGAGLIALSALLYSIFVIGSGRLAPRLGSIRFTSMALVVASVAVLLHVYFSDAPLFGLHTMVYVYGIIMAIFCTVIPSYLMTEGIRRLGAGDAAIVGAIGTVAKIVLEYFVLGESLNLVQALGAFLIIFGVVLIGRRKGD